MTADHKCRSWWLGTHGFGTFRWLAGIAGRTKKYGKPLKLPTNPANSRKCGMVFSISLSSYFSDNFSFKFRFVSCISFFARKNKANCSPKSLPWKIVGQVRDRLPGAGGRCVFLLHKTTIFLEHQNDQWFVEEKGHYSLPCWRLNIYICCIFRLPGLEWLQSFCEARKPPRGDVSFRLELQRMFGIWEKPPPMKDPILYTWSGFHGTGSFKAPVVGSPRGRRLQNNHHFGSFWIVLWKILPNSPRSGKLFEIVKDIGFRDRHFNIHRFFFPQKMARWSNLTRFFNWLANMAISNYTMNEDDFPTEYLDFLLLCKCTWDS